MNFRAPAPVFALIAAVATSGCARMDVVPDATPDRTAPAVVELAPGERTALPGGSVLRYVEVASDSRCPVDVQCIDAGEAVLRFELEAGADSQRFTLSTVEPHDRTAVGARSLRLLDATRDPPVRVRLQVDSAD